MVIDMNDYPSDPMNVNPIPGGVAETVPTSGEVAVQRPQPQQHTAGPDGFDVPEAVRSFVESSVAQLRESYERAKQALEDATSALEAALDKAGKGAAELNVKTMEMAQKNLNSGFEFAKKLASAKTPSEFVELQAAYMREQTEVMRAQAEEIQELAAKIATEATSPIQQQFSRTVERFASAS